MARRTREKRAGLEDEFAARREKEESLSSKLSIINGESAWVTMETPKTPRLSLFTMAIVHV